MGSEPQQPGLLLWLKMIAPTRRAKILLGVSFLLDVAGILVVTIAGLALTVVAAASPAYWWFVAIFALRFTSGVSCPFFPAR